MGRIFGDGRKAGKRRLMVGNLEYFKVFYYTAKAGSVTGAANELSISQPAVSQSLKALEQTLGVSLFKREAKGVRLTGEGRLLYSYVEKGYEQIEQGVEKLGQMLNLELGEVHIGASDMTLRFYLLPFLEIFHEKYPKIKVIVANAPTPETLELLRNGKIDFGVVSTPALAARDVKLTPVREIRDVFVAGEKFRYLKGKSLAYESLQSLPCILLEGNTSTRAFIDACLEERGVRLAPEFELATSDMIVQFAARNMGVGCVVEDFAREKLDSGELFVLDFDSPMPCRNICVATDRGTAMSPAGRKLLEMLVKS